MLEVLFKKNRLKITEKRYSYISSWLQSQLVYKRKTHAVSFIKEISLNYLMH